MRLVKLKASNVFSLGEVEVDLDRRGLVLVTGYSSDEGGANGAGKSSLANKAIIWGLYGQTAGGLKADEVVNRHSALPHFVNIQFEGSDGKNYTIKRSRKPASLELYSSSERLTRRNEKETQELINMALGRNFDIFVYSDFFGQGRDQNFLSIAPKDQKEILEQILPIAQLSQWASDAGLIRSEINSNVKELEKNISFREGGIEKLNSHLTNTRHSYRLWEEEHKKRIAECKTRIANYEKVNKAQLIAIATIEAALARAIISPDIFEQSVEVQKRVPEAQGAYSKATVAVKEWQAEVDKCVSVLSKKEDDKCGWCNQLLPTIMVEAQKSNITLYEGKLATANAALERSITAEEYYKKELAKVIEERTLLNAIVEKRSRELAERKKLQADLDLIKKNTEVDKLAAWNKELELLNKETNPHSESCDRIIYELNIESVNLSQDKTQLGHLKLQYDTLEFWQDAFSKDIKIYLLDRVCPFLTDRVSKHLEGLGNSQIKVTFSTTKQLKSGESRDEFNVDVSSSTGGSGYYSLSGGEQQIVSFAVGLALGDLAESQAIGISRILILDEPFVSLDTQNSEKLIHFLVGLQRRETILLISNEDNLKTLVPTNIHVRKHDGITRIG